MGHSKLPWKLIEVKSDKDTLVYRRITASSAGQDLRKPGIGFAGIYKNKEAEANANLIITAVNVIPKIKVFLKRLQAGNFQNEVVEMTAEILLKELEAVDVS